MTAAANIVTSDPNQDDWRTLYAEFHRILAHDALRFRVLDGKGLTHMAALPNARHERFAQYRAAGLTQGEAYRAAGYKGRSARTGGWNVEQHKSVKERIAALSDERLENQREARTELAEPVTIDRDWLLQSGRQVFDEAMKRHDLGTASVTVERMAKISGHWNEKPAPDNNHVIRVYSEKPLTEEEWIRIYCPQENEHILGPAKQDALVSGY